MRMHMQVSREAECPHGGFLYEMEDGTSVLFVMTGNAQLDADDFDHNGIFGHGHVGLRQRLIESTNANKATLAERTLRRRVIKEIVYLVTALVTYMHACIHTYIHTYTYMHAYR